MINKITRKQYPEIFEAVKDQFGLEMTYSNHRKYASFEGRCLMQISSYLKPYCPNVKNFDDLIGYWETNTYVYSDSDADYRDIKTLSRVVQKTRTIEESYWGRL